MLEIILAFGIPSAITGFGFWLLKRYIDKKDKDREEKESAKEDLMLLILKECRATNVLSTATAKAVQRIPDAKCNGDMTAALAEAASIQKAEKDFLVEQGIKHIFEKE